MTEHGENRFSLLKKNGERLRTKHHFSDHAITCTLRQIEWLDQGDDCYTVEDLDTGRVFKIGNRYASKVAT